MKRITKITPLHPLLVKGGRGDYQINPESGDEKLSLRVKRSNLTQSFIPSEERNLLRDCHGLSSRNNFSGWIAAHLSGARNDTNNRALTPDRWIWVNNNNGITLIELIIVISIIAILAVALGFQFQGWMGRYRAESQIKELYADLMNARARAMERNRTHFVTGSLSQYSIYEDTDPWPEGNGTLEVASDARLPGYPKTVEYAMTWTGSGSKIDFDRKGTISPVGSIYLTSSSDPAVSVHRDYDCLTISQTRINMGKWNGTTCVEK